MDVQRVRVGSQVWTLYEYDDDPQEAALAWFDDFLGKIRDAGVAIRVAN